MSKPSAYPIALILIIVIFSCVFFSVASVHSLNQDEGTYAVGALRFADGDLLLQKVNTDKPPMIYHMQGVAAAIFGKTEMSVKLPCAISLAVLFVLTYLIGAKLFGSAEGLFAALLMSVSPFLCFCGIGAMTDPPAVAFLTGSLLCVMSGRMWLTGLLFGLAVCTRQMAVLYLPVLIAVAAGYWPGQPDIKKTAFADLKNLVKGGFWPALWLVVWSGFFQLEKFHWLVQEMRSGKVTLGAKRAPFSERLDFWISEMAGFSISRWIFALAVIGGIALIAGRYLKRARNSNPGANAFTLYIFAGALIYYPLIHTIMGAPLYSRMMLPVLPIAAVILAYLVVTPIKRLLPERKIIGYLAWMGFAAVLILGCRINSKTFSLPTLKNDVPELCQFLKRNSGRQGMIVTSSMNREMLFYLHGNKIKRKQFKQSPQDVLKLIKGNMERDTFIALRSDESHYMSRISMAIAPEYYLEHKQSTSRGFIKIYKVTVNAEIVSKGEQTLVSYNRNGQDIFTPITVQSIEKALERYLKRSLVCDPEIKVVVEPPSSGDMTLGELKSLEIVATGLRLKKAPVEKMQVRFENLRVDIIKLIALDRLVVERADHKWGRIEMTQEGITDYIQSKNRDIENMLIQIQKQDVSITGALKAFGNTIEFSTSGPLTISEKGQVSMYISELVVVGKNLPGFIRSAIQSIVKPVLTIEIPALGLTGASLDCNEGRLTFEMR